MFTPRTEAAFLKEGRDLIAADDYPRALLEFRNASMAAPEMTSHTTKSV